MKPEILIRKEATDETVKQYLDQEFVWGEMDCGRLWIDHVARFGYRNPIADLGTWHTEKQALRALVKGLRAGGVKDGSDMGDLVGLRGFEPVAPSQAYLGDLLGFPGAEPFTTAVGVCLGNGRALAFVPMPDGRAFCTIGTQNVATKAWRVRCPS